jgi:hypothetical protein
MQKEPFDCWCRRMPALPRERLDPAGRCLCPECLAAEIAGRLSLSPAAADRERFSGR